jgi:hypothetical protein
MLDFNQLPQASDGDHPLQTQLLRLREAFGNDAD